MFSTPKKNIAEIEDAGCKAMVALFRGKPGDNLSAMRYSSLCQNVGSAKIFVTPERLPPTGDRLCYKVSCPAELPPSDALDRQW